LLQENVQVKPGQTFSLNLKLTIGGGNQSVTVTGSPVAAAPTPPPPPVGDDAAKPIGPVRVSTGTAAGMIISKVDPVYPDEAKAAHVQGTVVLRATISKTGDVEKLNVVSGPPELMVSAIDAVRQWKYKPYLLNGEPTEVQTTININFSLADSTATQAPTSQEYEAKVAALARAAQEYRDLIASAPAPPATAQAQAKLMQIEAELKQAQAQLAMQDARLNAIRTQYNGEPVRKVGGGVAAPVPIYQVEPQFTPEARKAKAAGMVVVQLIVDGQGLPQDVHVIRGFGIGPDGKPDPKMKKAARASAEGMNQNAVNAVKQYKFKPAMEDGKPVAAQINIEVNFKIF
jgi:TonB family protein